KHVDEPLLSEQLLYFALTLEWLQFLNQELAVKLEHQSSHAWPRPPAPEQPSLHNPPNEHVPQWITEEGKALHVARALAMQGGPPTPTPAQQALDRQRAEKRAAREEQIRKSREGEQNAKERSAPPPETETPQG